MKTLSQLQIDLDIGRRELAALLLEKNSQLYVYCQSEKLFTSFDDEQNYILEASGLMVVDAASKAQYLQAIKYNKKAKADALKLRVAADCFIKEPGCSYDLFYAEEDNPFCSLERRSCANKAGQFIQEKVECFLEHKIIKDGQGRFPISRAFIPADAIEKLVENEQRTEVVGEALTEVETIAESDESKAEEHEYVDSEEELTERLARYCIDVLFSKRFDVPKTLNISFDDLFIDDYQDIVSDKTPDNPLENRKLKDINALLVYRVCELIEEINTAYPDKSYDKKSSPLLYLLINKRLLKNKEGKGQNGKLITTSLLSNFIAGSDTGSEYKIDRFGASTIEKELNKFMPHKDFDGENSPYQWSVKSHEK